MIAHEKPAQRASWATHGGDGWYLGPVLEHYRCYCVYITQTHGEQHSDTVEFFPQHVLMPKLSTADAAIRAALQLLAALQDPTPAAPFPTPMQT
jgi:hypothetical protein